MNEIERHRQMVESLRNILANFNSKRSLDEVLDFIAEQNNRLACELHDSVIQTLFSATLIADILPELWDLDQKMGREHLAELCRLSRKALAEMYTLLLERRPAAPIETDLDDLLRQLAAAMLDRTSDCIQQAGFILPFFEPVQLCYNRCMRFFNTAGPCDPDKHYTLPAAARLDDFNVRHLIEQEAYFVLHAPRQVGKTTAMLELARALTASEQYVAVLVSMEVGAGFPDDIEAAELAILSEWRYSIRFQLPESLQPSVWTPEAGAGQRIGAMLGEWAAAAPRPLVVFLDEIDSLRDDVLISVLRQLRSGYFRRPTAFPTSLALIGLRDVRDYKVAAGGSDRLQTASPFNIAARSIALRDFTAAEVAALLEQHTAETGQAFTTEATARLFQLTQGQPWLVNALAKVAVEELVTEPSRSVEIAHIEAAKESLIVRRQTHLDQLADKLRQPRVRKVIEPILAGGVLSDVPQDDRDYVVDLGLVKRANGGGLVIANPIYREVIPRALASGPQDSLPHIQPTWLTSEGRLDVDRLLEAFLAFWRQHGQPLLASAPYHEIAPHLVMMAFLHRVVNSGGTLEREYAIGSGRMDLCLRYGSVILGIELKVWRDHKPDPLTQGLKQLDLYLSGLGLETGWLVIFDQRSGLPDISERAAAEPATTPAGRQITVVRA